MYIEDSLLEKILELCIFEYGGCHAPHAETPLYGRAAYWRAYLPDGQYVCKITTPVKLMEPSPARLNKLLKAELRKRFEAIHERVTLDDHGQIYIAYRDPSGVKPLTKCIVGKYIDIHFKREFCDVY